MRGAFAIVDIFVFCGCPFLNQLDVMWETHFSCDTDGRALSVTSTLFAAVP